MESEYRAAVGRGDSYQIWVYASAEAAQAETIPGCNVVEVIEDPAQHQIDSCDEVIG